MMRIHSRISGIRKELLHKLTTPRVKSLKVIKIGELNVKGMMANHKLALAIALLNKMRYTPLATDAHGGLCPMPYALCPPEHLMLLRKAIYLTLAFINSGVNLNISARCMGRQEC